MLKVRDDVTLSREKAIAAGIVDVATELRMIDVADLIAFIRIEQFANIANLVNSSAELYFKPGLLRFGFSADLNLDWWRPPRIALDMEFQNLDVAAYFRLVLEAQNAAVEATHIAFKGPVRSAEMNTAHLIEAIADARLTPMATGRRQRSGDTRPAKLPDDRTGREQA